MVMVSIWWENFEQFLFQIELKLSNVAGQEKKKKVAQKKLGCFFNNTCLSEKLLPKHTFSLSLLAYLSACLFFSLCIYVIYACI